MNLISENFNQIITFGTKTEGDFTNELQNFS